MIHCKSPTSQRSLETSAMTSSLSPKMISLLAMMILQPPNDQIQTGWEIVSWKVQRSISTCNKLAKGYSTSMKEDQKFDNLFARSDVWTHFHLCVTVRGSGPYTLEWSKTSSLELPSFDISAGSLLEPVKPINFEVPLNTENFAAPFPSYYACNSREPTQC